MFSIYIITNEITGKRYVGLTSASIARRWGQHKSDAKVGKKSALYNSIRKYGPGAFIVKDFASARSMEDLLLLEALVIEQEGTQRPLGYNITKGGEGVLGMRHSDEARRKMSETRKGRKASAETIIKMRAAQVGRKLTPEQREKKSRDRKALLATGWRPNGRPKGLKHTEEAKRKMSAAKIGKPMKIDRRKLTAKQVAEIRWLAECKTKNKHIAALYGLSPNYINVLKTNRIWPNLGTSMPEMG